MAHVDDLIQPRPEQVLLARLATLPWLHDSPASIRFPARESRIRFARNRHPKPYFPAKSITSAQPFCTQNQRLRNSSRTTI
jgi:hypothetical protein